MFLLINAGIPVVSKSYLSYVIRSLSISFAATTLDYWVHILADLKPENENYLLRWLMTFFPSFTWRSIFRFSAIFQIMMDQ